jgi:hypothetical protein
MATICTSNLTSGFIDLATYDEQEKYMYGGPNATAYFVRDVRKATWFTQVPTVLSKNSGSAEFGQQWSVNISRAGDYLLYTYIRLLLPAVTLAAANQATAAGGVGQLRWTHNLLHNLCREVCVTFNDLVAMKIDHWFLDFWSAFTLVASKAIGYNNMIGNTANLTAGALAGVPLPAQPANAVPGAAAVGTWLNIPLPLFYSRDSGVALPTAALPYNDMKINISFRDWDELLVLDNLGPYGATPVYYFKPVASDLVGSTPQLSQVNVWANYAIVSNTERKKMGCAPRDILIEQVQTAPVQTFNPLQNRNPSYDIRFSHAVKLVLFGVRNTTNSSDWSNYSTGSVVPVPGASAIPVGLQYDPVEHTSLLYENTMRLASMGSDYYSLVQPWYHAPAIPDVVGYHMYSYSLCFYEVDPMGSTNFGKLTNVSLAPVASQVAFDAATVNVGVSQVAQTFQTVILGVNNNIIRISGGAMGKIGRPIIGSCYESCGQTFIDKQYNCHLLTCC